ncbi:uncharacterized protein VTP21DRAFT_5754 [Calcarisporiella thermophila]|uniref:uncharacterized protein n=1 Tax=Calcarisporiella thermophila TaxID=911321 RepID=UPI00374322F9
MTEYNSIDALSSKNFNNITGVDAERMEEIDPEQLRVAADIIEQDTSQVPEFWVKKYKNEAAKNWDLFYKRNTTNFFKDRHWVDREFAELVPDGNSKTVLEIGCGVGNFLFPTLKSNPDLFIYACDFSKRAVEFVKANAEYDEKRCKAFVCDLTKDDLTDNIPSTTIDIVSAIFVFSAIPPESFSSAIRNLCSVLKPGGIILFRDYARYDAAQIKFAKSPGHKLAKDLYVRQDGTLSHFGTVESISSTFEREGFKTILCEYVYRQTTNRKLEMCVDRIFVQGKFQKF